MPQIKPYEIQTQARNAPDVETPRLDQFGRAGAGLQHLANAGYEFSDALHKAQTQKETSDAHVQISQAQNEWSDELRARTQDGTLDSDEFKKDMADSVDKLGEKYSTPGAQLYFTQVSSAMKAHLLEKSYQSEAELQGQKAVTDHHTALNATSSALINDPSSFELNKKLQDQSTDELVANQSLPALKGEALKRSDQTELAKSAVRGWIKLNPDDATEQLNKGQWDQYINGDLKHALLAEANQQKHANEVENMRLQKNQDDIIKQQQLDVQNGFLEKMVDGTLSAKDVLNSNLDPFGSGSKQQFLQMIHRDTTAPIKTDKNVFNDLFTRIHLDDGDVKKITNENDLNAYVSRGVLSIKDAKLLRNEISGKGTSEGDANNMLKKSLTQSAYTSIAKPDPMTKLPDPEGAKLYQAWLSDFLTKYQDGVKNGKSPSKMLDPGSPDYLGNNINSFKRKPEDIINDLAKPKGPTTNPSGVPPTPPEPMVDVISPDGQPGKLPQSKVEEAKARGFKVGK